jgi:hypothetical protein
MDHTGLYANFIYVSFFYTGAHLSKKFTKNLHVLLFRIPICIQFFVYNIQINNSICLS